MARPRCSLRPSIRWSPISRRYNQLCNPKSQQLIAEQRKAKEAGDIGEIEKHGVNTGRFAINPFNGEKVPIWIANYILMDYGTGAIMSVPAHDERDYDFAKKYKLEIRLVILPISNDPEETMTRAEAAVCRA